MKFVSIRNRGVKRKQPYHIIDDGIRPLVDALNAIEGVNTIASCEGHFTLGKTPYVYFSASAGFARTLEKILRDAPEHGVIHAGWSVKAVFNQNYRMVFILRAASYEHEAWSIAGQLYRFFFRRHIDADIRHITLLAEKAGVHHFRNGVGKENKQRHHHYHKA